MSSTLLLAFTEVRQAPQAVCELSCNTRTHGWWFTESWQNGGALSASKADLSSFCLELSKKMNMDYRLPPMPVDVTMKQPGDRRIDAALDATGSVDIGTSVAAMFDPN